MLAPSHLIAHPPPAMAHVITALVAFAWVGLAACGDDPAVRSLLAERPNGVVHAGPDATGAADATAADTATPDDTTPPDTLDDGTAPLDTSHPQDTPDTVDTADAATSDTQETVETQDSTPDSTTDATVDSDPGEVTQGGPSLALQSTIALPWVRAGGGGTELLLELDNAGDPGTFTATLTGDARLHLDAYDGAITDSARLTLRFDGAASPTTVEATLRISDHAGTRQATVWAVAGAVLPTADWADLTTGPIRYGQTATVRLATAPFPDSSGSWSDDRVNVFVPDGYLDRGPVPVVVHFHGHGTTLAATLPYHKYREQLWASGVNAILVTPQGPVDAASGNFGKLMDPGGLDALLRDVIAILYRDRLVRTPKVGDLVLTEHSGGYQAVALNLDAQTDEGQVLSAHLFDGLYGYSSAYEDFARAGGYLRSEYTSAGGTRANNLALVDDLGALVVEDASAESLRDETAVVWFTPACHSDSTGWSRPTARPCVGARPTRAAARASSCARPPSAVARRPSPGSRRMTTGRPRTRSRPRPTASSGASSRTGRPERRSRHLCVERRAPRARGAGGRGPRSRPCAAVRQLLDRGVQCAGECPCGRWVRPHHRWLLG